MKFVTTYEEFLVCVIDMSYDLKFVIDIPYDRNNYVDTSCPDAPVTPHLLNPRCEHRKEAHVKQSKISKHCHSCLLLLPVQECE
jgi:hypothetical protein